MWISRLDQDARPKLSDNTLIYEARYVDAAHLADIVYSSYDTGYQAPYRREPREGELREGEQPGGYAQPSQRGGSSLFDSVSVKVDPGRNAIIAKGSHEELRSLQNIIEALDQPKRQVLIEATIVEVSLSENNQFGVQWDLVESKLRSTFSDTGSGTVTSLFPGASFLTLIVASERS